MYSPLGEENKKKAGTELRNWEERVSKCKGKHVSFIPTSSFKLVIKENFTNSLGLTINPPPCVTGIFYPLIFRLFVWTNRRDTQAWTEWQPEPSLSSPNISLYRFIHVSHFFTVSCCLWITDPQHALLRFFSLHTNPLFITRGFCKKKKVLMWEEKRGE